MPKTIGFSPFADEAIHFLSIRTLTYKSEINSELGKAHIWLFENKLSINIEKSNFCYFLSSTKTNSQKGYAIYK